MIPRPAEALTTGRKEVGACDVDLDTTEARDTRPFSPGAAGTPVPPTPPVLAEPHSVRQSGWSCSVYDVLGWVLVKGEVVKPVSLSKQTPPVSRKLPFPTNERAPMLLSAQHP